MERRLHFFCIGMAPDGHNSMEGMLPIGNILKVMRMEIKRLRDLREDHDKTQQELADYLCVERSAMSAVLGKLRDEGYLTFHRSRFRLNTGMGE